MSLQPLSHPTGVFFNSSPAFSDTPLDIVVGNQPITLKELAERIVKQALGGADEQTVADFLRQSGFTLNDAPPFHQAGDNSFYRFTPDEKFRASLEQFQKTGQARPLPPPPAKPAPTPPSHPPGNRRQLGPGQQSLYPRTVQRDLLRQPRQRRKGP